jgi:tetratricopeptide (TPR) repeat protein
MTAAAGPPCSRLRRLGVACLALAVLGPPATGLAGATAGQGAGRGAAAPAAELSRAQRLIESGSFPEAISLLRGTVERHPGDADARRLLGTALALLPRRSEALEELQAAVRLRPDFAPGYYALGMALARFVEPEQARVAFEKAIERDPRFAPAHVNLALVLAQLRRLDDALRHLETAVEIEGDSPAAANAHRLRGLLYREQDRPEQAVAAFEKAVALSPDDAEAFLHLGLARRKLLDDKGAVAALREAVRLSPDNPEARYELGRDLLRAGQAREALVHLRAAVRSRPEDMAALYNLARALRTDGQTGEAEEVAARILEIRSRTEQARQHVFKGSQLNNEGIELERSGKLEAAVDRYASALEVDPLNTVFRRNLALALCRKGRWQEGIQELREVLRLDPNDEAAAKALYIAQEMAQRKP